MPLGGPGARSQCPLHGHEGRVFTLAVLFHTAPGWLTHLRLLPHCGSTCVSLLQQHEQ